MQKFDWFHDAATDVLALRLARRHSAHCSDVSGLFSCAGSCTPSVAMLTRRACTLTRTLSLAWLLHPDCPPQHVSAYGLKSAILKTMHQEVEFKSAVRKVMYQDAVTLAESHHRKAGVAKLHYLTVS